MLRVEVVSRKWGTRKKKVRVHNEHKVFIHVDSFTYMTQKRVPM
jgi:hypothetical protein